MPKEQALTANPARTMCVSPRCFSNFHIVASSNCGASAGAMRQHVAKPVREAAFATSLIPNGVADGDADGFGGRGSHGCELGSIAGIEPRCLPLLGKGFRLEKCGSESFGENQG